MARKRANAYTVEQLDFIREQYQTLSLPLLVEAFNRHYRQNKTLTAMKSVLGNHKIRCGGQGRKDLWQSTVFTEAESKWIAKWYSRMSAAEVAIKAAAKFGRPFSTEQIKAFTTTRKMKGSSTGRFAKGTVPPNKGLRRPGYAPGKMGSTQFKAGPRPDMRLPIGHERVDKDGYILVKVDMINPHTGIQGYYQHKHRVIWEAANGQIPANHVLTFIDDDTSNCVLDNLELITRSELCRRNKMQYKQAPPELRDTIKLVAKLQHDTALVQCKEK